MHTKYLAMLLFALPLGNVYAQAAAKFDANRNATGTDELKTIIVTARKVKESLQDVPVSVAAVTGSQLEAASIHQVQDLTNSLPNFQFVTAGVSGLTDVEVRGVDVGVLNPGFSPSVSFYVDGVYQGRPHNFNQDLVDIERVELLLGPQGTYFGANTIAGAVNIVTRRPSQTFDAFVQASGGNYQYGDLRGSVNLPLGNGLAVRVSAAETTRAGYQKNLFTGRAQGNLNRTSGRVQVLKHLDSTDILLTLDDQHSNERPQAFEYNQLVYTLGVPSTYSAHPTPLTISQNPSTSVVTREAASLHIDHRFSPTASLTSITAWEKTSNDDDLDQDYQADPRVESYVLDQEAERLISQEIRLEAEATTSVRYTVGLFYLDDRETMGRNLFYPPPEILLGPLGALDFEIPTYSDMDSKSYAAYGNVDWKLAEKLTLTVGGRYSRVEQSTLYDQNELFLAEGGIQSAAFAESILGPGHSGLLVANAPPYDGSRADNLPSWTGTLSYQFNPDRMLYLRYARGVKEGGFNLQPLPDPLPSSRGFGPEKLDDYELGMKSEWLDRHLRVNGDVFYENYRGLQRADLIPIYPVGHTSVIRNVGKVKIVGGELSVAALPAPGLEFNANLGVADAKYVTYVLNSGVNLSGQPLSGVPKWNASVEASYEHDISQGFQLFSNISAHMRGPVLLGSSDIAAINTGGYAVYDGRLGVRPVSDAWEVFLWGKNLSNKVYVTARDTGTDFFAADLVAYGLPRMYGITVRYNFYGQ